MKKLFVFDLDGTLVTGERHRINDLTKDALFELKKDPNNILVVATGRGMSGVGIGPNYSVFDYFITNNGSNVYDKSRDKIDEKVVNKKNAEVLMDVANKHDSVFISAFADGKSYLLKQTKFATPFVEMKYGRQVSYHPEVSLEEMRREIENTNISQATVLTDGSMVDSLIKDEVEPNIIDDHIQVSGGVFIDVNHPDADKFSGIEFIAQRENIDVKDITAFGDSGNDINMISKVGTGICMGNGNDNVKLQAKHVIGDHTSDAIGKFLFENYL